MKNFYNTLFKNSLTVFLTVIVSSLLIAGIVFASTTISENITTGGTLDVTGVATFDQATSTSATSTDYLYIGPDGTEDHFDFQGGDLYVRNDAEIDGTTYMNWVTSPSATTTAYLYVGSDITEDSNIDFSGDLIVGDDANIDGDLYMGEGIDLQSATNAIGIDLGGTFDTAAINIDGTYTNGIVFGETTTGRAIVIGTKASAATSLPITATSFEAEPGNNYLFGLFAAVADDSAATSADELRGAWIRTRVNEGMHVGSNDGWGFGVCGAEIQLKIYGDTDDTDMYSWQNSAVWAQLETQGDPNTVTFKDGSYSQAVLANVGLTAKTTIESDAVVAGVTINSNTASSNVTATGGFYGLFITDKTGSNLNFKTGIHIVGGAVDKILQAGSGSSDAVTNDTAGTKFVSIYTDSGATSGDARGIYNRLYLTGIGGGGESLRSYTDIVGVAAATAHGAHISLGMGESTTAGSVTGLGVGVRSTLSLPDAALASGGTYAAIMAEMFSHGAGTDGDVSAVTELSFIRIVNDGTATGRGNVDDKAALFAFDDGFGTSSGDMIYTHAADPGNAAGSIRILINGTAKYLKYWDAE